MFHCAHKSEEMSKAVEVTIMALISLGDGERYEVVGGAGLLITGGCGCVGKARLWSLQEKNSFVSLCHPTHPEVL